MRSKIIAISAVLPFCAIILIIYNQYQLYKKHYLDVISLAKVSIDELDSNKFGKSIRYDSPLNQVVIAGSEGKIVDNIVKTASTELSFEIFFPQLGKNVARFYTISKCDVGYC